MRSTHQNYYGSSGDNPRSRVRLLAKDGGNAEPRFPRRTNKNRVSLDCIMDCNKTAHHLKATEVYLPIHT
ncbi:MAG: hypothetical protein HFP76_01970 [Methylococcales symbiont of Iophon sp. n. MRB-2018]|nr:MAG: hypothetical protein HFP76_01970 [Methylococcales symbiont of Iophon sp. n. MRB-2018]